MPESRTRPHLPAVHSSLTPQMVGRPITRRSGSALEHANLDVAAAGIDMDENTNPLEEKASKLPSSANALFGSWYNDIENIEIKHMIIFKQDGSGSLKSQGNVDGQGAKLLNFSYRLAEDQSHLFLFYLPLSPLISNPFEQAKYVQSADIPSSEVSLKLNVFEREIDGDSYSFLAPSGKTYEPTFALEFERSPWPLDLFPGRVRYYGALRRIRANKTKEF